MIEPAAPAPPYPARPPLVTRLVLLGHPVSHSLSPRFQRAALDAAGLPLRYDAIDVDDASFDAVVDDLVAQRAAGNVTVPHKARMAARCDELMPAARDADAVNCWWVDAAGRLVGDNTDIGGFARAATQLLDGETVGARVALIGAGGAAAAVAVAVASWPGAELRVWSRSADRARAFATRRAGFVRAVSTADDALRGATLVVNATPLGLRDEDALPVGIDRMPAGAAALDLVYALAHTRWVRELRLAGFAADDGLTMLVEQGALAFERWFGRPPDREAMWRAVGHDRGAESA